MLSNFGNCLHGPGKTQGGTWGGVWFAPGLLSLLLISISKDLVVIPRDFLPVL